MASPSSSVKKAAGETSDREGSESGATAEERSAKSEYFGWVYHLGVNSIGHEYCHLRFLFIRGKYVEMYKRDPHENPGIKPIRKGVVGPTLMVEELGRRKVNQGDVYVLRFYNRLDEAKKGEIACPGAGEAQKWMEAFDHAKQQAEYELAKGRSVREKLNMENEINLEGHRPRVRRYAHGLRKLIRIGQGPETLLRHSSKYGANFRPDGYIEGDAGDAIEAHEWKCVRTIDGIRIFEDVASTKDGKGVLVKSVGVIDAKADTVFEVLLNLERHQRYEWDALSGDLELVESYDGHYDVVYGICNPKHLTGWQSKKDFVFSRQWFCGQDGTYTILQFPAVHKKQPPKPGYQRTKVIRFSPSVQCFSCSFSWLLPALLQWGLISLKVEHKTIHITSLTGQDPWRILHPGVFGPSDYSVRLGFEVGSVAIAEFLEYKIERGLQPQAAFSQPCSAASLVQKLLGDICLSAETVGTREAQSIVIPKGSKTDGWWEAEKIIIAA